MRVVRATYSDQSGKQCMHLQNSVNVLLFLSTIFRPKSNLLARSIQTQLATIANASVKEVVMLVKFTFARFDSRYGK